MGISISMCFEFRVIEVKPDAFCLASIPCPSETGIPPFDQARSHPNRWSPAAAAKRPCMNIKCVCEGQDSRLRMSKLFSIPSFRADGEWGSASPGMNQRQKWQICLLGCTASSAMGKGHCQGCYQSSYAHLIASFQRKPSSHWLKNASGCPMWILKKGEKSMGSCLMRTCLRTCVGIKAPKVPTE